MRAEDLGLFLRAFVAAELFKLRRSRLAKMTIVATMVISPAITGVVWLLLGDESMSTFPRVLELIYVPLWLLVELSGLLLTVEVMGSEFDGGTVRTIVGRGAPRWLFISGKAIALFIAVAVNASVGAFSGGVFAAISHLSQMGTEGLVNGLGEFLTSFLPAVGIVSLVGLAYIGILLLLVVLARSSAPAMLVGLVILGGDFVIQAIGVEGFDPGAYSINGNTFVLFSRIIESSLSTAVEGSAGPGRAFFTLALYAGVGVIAAYYVFKQQDLADKR
jgi:ABC-type transport system involved in multi-copper enzyme maturation permease subunit